MLWTLTFSVKPHCGTESAAPVFSAFSQILTTPSLHSKYSQQQWRYTARHKHRGTSEVVALCNTELLHLKLKWLAYEQTHTSTILNTPLFHRSFPACTTPGAYTGPKNPKQCTTVQLQNKKLSYHRESARCHHKSYVARTIGIDSLSCSCVANSMGLASANLTQWLRNLPYCVK